MFQFCFTRFRKYFSSVRAVLTNTGKFRMKPREFLQRILFKFLYIKNEKLKQFFISVFFLLLISFIVLAIILVKQNSENRIKKNILEAVSKSRESDGQDIFQEESSRPAAQGKDGNTSSAGQEKRTLVVFICGEIGNPGVYEVADGSRINDLIKAAGGTSINACLELINPAQKLVDGQKVYIPSVEESKDFVFSGGEDNAAICENHGTEIININYASKKELETLPGIGSELASRIIQYREMHGGFQSIEELRKVSGIGDKKFSDIKDMVTV